MDISGKKTKVWRKDVEGRNGTFHRYSVAVSSKREDGSYASVYLPIKFAKKCNAPEKIPNGTECDFKGFLSVDTYRDRDGNEVRNLSIIAMEVYFDENEIEDGLGREVEDSFQEAEDDIPFK